MAKKKKKSSKGKDSLCGGICSPMQNDKPMMHVSMNKTITDKNQMAKILLGVDKKKGGK